MPHLLRAARLAKASSAGACSLQRHIPAMTRHCSNTQAPLLGKDLELLNRSELLPMVDAALGRHKPPAVEYLVASAVRGSALVPWYKRLLGNPCGHALVAYTLPEDGPGISHVAPELRGKRIVMNIVNPGHASLSDVHIVNFLPLEDMLFGIGDMEGQCGSEQGGVYNRAFTGLRFEEVPPEDVLSMHHTYLSLASQGNAGRLSFSITGGQMRGLAQRFLNIGNRGIGNCALWTAAGLVAAGLIRRPSVFPGRVWAMLHEGALKRGDGSNINVVHYAEIPKCYKRYPRLESAPGELASITGPLTTWKYWRRERFAHVTVSVEEGADVATVTPRKSPPTPTLPMPGLVPGMPGPRFLGLGASIVGLASNGYPGCAVVLGLVVTLLH